MMGVMLLGLKQLDPTAVPEQHKLGFCNSLGAQRGALIIAYGMLTPTGVGMWDWNFPVSENFSACLLRALAP